MEKAVEAGIKAKAFRKTDAAEWARTYAALIDGLALHVLLHPESVTPERMRTAIRAHIAVSLG
jgi:superfamily II DNA helicase RecQ